MVDAPDIYRQNLANGTTDRHGNHGKKCANLNQRGPRQENLGSSGEEGLKNRKNLLSRLRDYVTTFKRPGGISLKGKMGKKSPKHKKNLEIDPFKPAKALSRSPETNTSKQGNEKQQNAIGKRNRGDELESSDQEGVKKSKRSEMPQTPQDEYKSTISESSLELRHTKKKRGTNLQNIITSGNTSDSEGEADSNSNEGDGKSETDTSGDEMEEEELLALSPITQNKTRITINKIRRCMRNIRTATTRCKKGKVQFNLTDRESVRKNMDVWAEECIGMAYEMGRLEERTKRQESEIKAMRGHLKVLEKYNEEILKQCDSIKSEVQQLSQDSKSKQKNEEETRPVTSSDTEKKSYAATVANTQESKWTSPDQKHKDTETEIALKGDNQSADNTLMALKKIAANKISEGVREVIKKQSGTVIIKLKSKQDKDKIEELVEGDKNLEIIVPKQYRPKFTITGVTTGYSEEQLKELILQENEEIMKSYKSALEHGTTLIRRTRCRNPNKENWIFETEPHFFRYLMSKAKIYCDMMVLYVNEIVDVAICFRCAKFGHIAKYCKEQHETCHKCGGAHEGKECPEEAKLNCPNCRTKGLEPREHTARDRNCPVYQQKLRQYRNRIDYGPKTQTQ